MPDTNESKMKVAGKSAAAGDRFVDVLTRKSKGQQLYFLIRGNCLIFASAEGGDSERMRGCGGEGG